ncbi:MAG: nitroreductase family protein [Clostridia bacterium]|nr:nitroreductase family protein [Clostridia bacterium]
MLYCDVKELAYNARSIRAFDVSRSAGEEMLKHFVECAVLCPSAANLQPLKFKLCFEKNEVDALFPLTRWAGYLKDRQIPPAGEEPTDFIVICHDTSVSPISEYSTMDVGIVAQTINLAACEKGFGCCMIGSFDKKATSELFSLPENLIPVLVLALGTPKESPIICSIGEDGSTKYFRDDANLHFVPKRQAEDVIVK